MQFREPSSFYLKFVMLWPLCVSFFWGCKQKRVQKVSPLSVFRIKSHTSERPHRHSPCWGWSPRRRWGWAGLPGRVGRARGSVPFFLPPACGCSQTGWCCPRPEDSAPAGKTAQKKTIRESAQHAEAAQHNTGALIKYEQADDPGWKQQDFQIQLQFKKTLVT